MSDMWMAVFTVVGILLSLWIGSLGAKHRNKFVGYSAGALTWALWRTFFVKFSWNFVRPLDFLEMLLVALFLGIVLIISWYDKLSSSSTTTDDDARSNRRKKVFAWLAAIVAVLGPFFDLFSPQFWLGWLHESAWISITMIVLILAVALITAAKNKRLAAVFAIWGVIALLLYIQYTSTGAAGPTNQVVPTASATPASSAETIPPTSTPDTESKSLTATEGSLIGWDNVVKLVDDQNARWWAQGLNDHQSTLGFSWDIGNKDNVKAWGDTRASNGKVLGVQLVVVFDDPDKAISKAKAREIAGVAGTKVPVVRAGVSYTRVFDKTEVRPAGNDRVVMFLAPIGVEDSGKVVLKLESGVALVPAGDNKVELTPATYNYVAG